MSVSALKTLLEEARTELDALAKLAAGRDALDRSALSSIKYTHAKMSKRIDEALTQAAKMPRWRSPESGTWHAKIGTYDTSVYKEGGSYYWHVGCTDNAPAKSLEEASEIIYRMTGLM